MSDLLHDRCDLSQDHIGWLQRLVSDWQTLADLSYADLALATPTRDGDVVIVALCRPSTAPTMYLSDPVGVVLGGAEIPELGRVLAGEHVTIPAGSWPVGDPVAPLLGHPVARAGRIIAAMIRSEPQGRMSQSALEVAYLDIADDLVAMIGEGSYPDQSAPTGGRRGAPRVGDGLVRLDAEGVVTFASPNALSCFHRLGYLGGLQGELLAEVTTALLGGPEPVDETLPLVVTGRASMRTTVLSRRGVAVALRAIPLTSGGARKAAIVLCRDITELHRGELELMSKEAIIREIHHRVKNNLQTVSALLRMQARRMSSPEARLALEEAMRRVATIAMVHETLLLGLDETVDLDLLLDKSLSLISPLVWPAAGQVSLTRVGSGGRVHAKEANALALVVTELVANALEHAGCGQGEGEANLASVTLELSRDRDRLQVRVVDDGAGLPARFQPGAAGLGTSIVQALVQGELGGQIRWESSPGEGTTVTVSCRVRGE